MLLRTLSALYKHLGIIDDIYIQNTQGLISITLKFINGITRERTQDESIQLNILE